MRVWMPALLLMLGCIDLEDLPPPTPGDAGARDARVDARMQDAAGQPTDVGAARDAALADAAQDLAVADATRDARAADVGPPAVCRDDDDCELPPCWASQCIDGRCVDEPLSGRRCDDGLFCTVDDQCVRGTCEGVQRICNQNEAVCDRETDRCRIPCTAQEDCRLLDTGCQYAGDTCSTQGFHVEGRCVDDFCIEQPVQAGCVRDTDSQICANRGRCQAGQCVRPDVVPVDLNCRQSTRIAVYCNGQPVLDEACPMEDRRFECPRATEVDVCCSSDPTVPCGQAGLAGENIRLTIENGLQEAVCGGPQMGEWRTCSGRLYRPIEIRCELFP